MLTKNVERFFKKKTCNAFLKKKRVTHGDSKKKIIFLKTSPLLQLKRARARRSKQNYPRTQCHCYRNSTLYDHEHALFRCSKVQKFWVLINRLLLKLAGGSFIGKNYGLSVTSTLTLATCNINTQHNSFYIGILTAAQNVMGLALASIVSASIRGTYTDLKTHFCKLLSEYFFNTLQTLKLQSDNKRQKFLRLWDFCISKTNSSLNSTVVEYKFTPLIYG